MDWKGHILFGSILLILFLCLDFFVLHWLNLDYKMYVVFIPILLFGFMLLDIDAVISKPKILITFLLIAVSIASYFLYSSLLSIISIIFLGVVWMINPIFGHRGKIHSIIFILIISLPLILIDYKLAILFAICAWSHLLFDGIPFKVI